MWLGRHLGEAFKWLFYGDDDTVFLVEAAIQVVRTLDPDLPYFLTGGAPLIIALRSSRPVCSPELLPTMLSRW